MRVTLAGIFLKFFLTLYIYYLWKIIFILNRLSGAFQTRLFSYKEIWNYIYIYIILFGVVHWSGMTWNVYLYSICSDLRVYDDRKGRVMLWKIWDVEVLSYCRELQKCMILILWYWMELWLRSWIWWMKYIWIWWALHDTAIYVPSRDDNCR